jgi:glycosyltransferase involved in cell wall biosynthesis
MKALVLSTLFPNPQKSLQGLFVRERIRHVTRDASIRVVAPVPWFARGSIPYVETQDDLQVFHPTFLYIPVIFKVLDGFFLFLSSLPTVSRIRREFDFDLVDAHFAFPDGMAGVLLGRWFHKPVVITMRGSERAFVEHRLRRSAIGWTLRHATRVIAVSQGLAELACDLGTSSARVHVIPNGADTKRFSPRDRSTARHELGLTGTGPLIVSVGHLVPLKGFHRVIEVFKDLVCEFPDATLAIVGGSGAGTGNYPDQLAQLVSRLGLTDRVRLVGAEPPDRVATWLNAADLLVLDSDREGSPNVVCEALACGCPVVAPRVGEVGNMVPPHGGIIFERPQDLGELKDALRTALKLNWDRAAIRRSAEDNTWDRVGERVRRVWDEATGQAQPRRLPDSSVAARR